MFRRVLTITVLFVLSVAADDKPKGAPLVKLPPKTEDIANIKLPAASQPCMSYAIAVSIEAMLRAQKVPLDQHFWVQRANGGEACEDRMPDLDRLARAIDGTYVLDDGSKVRLETHIISGAPTSPGDAIAPLRQGIPLLVLWKSRAYLLHGAVYDEYIYPNGQRMFQITELKMTDPLAPAKEREVSFKNATDDPADIAAVIRVQATALNPNAWN